MEDSPCTLAEVEGLQAAFWQAMEDAKEREHLMPTSAAAIRMRADNIKSLRDKILATMPHVDRRNYPPSLAFGELTQAIG